MKKKQTTQWPSSLRRCVSNEFLSMEVIPQISPEPYFVRKQIEQNRTQRGSSLTSRKNKLIQPKKIDGTKQKFPIDRNKFRIDQKQQNKNRKFNSPLKTDRFPVLHSYSQLQTNATNFYMQENASDKNFSDQKVSSSCKSVKFSNRLDDNKSVNSKREGSRTPSILKNKNPKYGAGSGLSSIPSERSFSINNSFHSNHKEIKKKIIQQSNTNTLIKKKYEAILKTLQAKQSKNKPPLPGRKNLKLQSVSKEKYQDDIFPPVYSSVFPYNPKAIKPQQKKGKQIQWKRISEIFPNKKLVIFDRPEPVPKYFDSTKQESKVTKISITRDKHSYAGEFIVTAFNAIKNNDELLCKIFQNQEINNYGIYLVKIFQENTWKYIIIDDFIPVIRSNLEKTNFPYVPAFINIKPELDQKDKKQRKNQIEEYLPIWPFLLEKAYANYYSSYEALTHGNVLDIVQEFCGISYEKINLVQKTDPEEYLEVIDKLLLGLKNGNVVVLAQLKQQLPMIPLYYKAEFCYSMITEEELFYYDPHEDYRPCRIKFYDMGLICTHLFLFSPSKFVKQISCTISKPKHKVSANLMTKINKDENIIPRDIPSIRKFVLRSTSQCNIFIRQKDNRFVFRLQREYFWLRVLLIGKEYDGTYRWIDGQYSNSKSISFSNVLDEGEYFLFVYPQWSKQKYYQEIYMTVFCNENIQNFERVQFDPKSRMIEQACTDLAQKKGKLNQINKFICSYNYVDQKSAIVVQNINNERLFGQVNIVRSIVGLKCKVQIIPVNDEFYQDLKDNSNQQGAEYLAVKKSTIDVKIQKSESFTVILKMRGGIDHKFFKAFTFGS